MSPYMSGSYDFVGSRGDGVGVRVTRRSLADTVKAMGGRVGLKGKGVVKASLSDVVDGVDGSTEVFSPPSLATPEQLVMLSKEGLLDAHMQMVDLWACYYACKQAAIHKGVSQTSSVASSRVSVASWKSVRSDKFQALGDRRRSSAAKVEETCHLSDGSKVVLAGAGKLPGDYPSEELVESYGYGACYLHLIRKGFVGQVFSALGVWPTVEELLAVPGECFIQSGGLQFRVCKVVDQKVHVSVGFSGPTFITVLSELSATVDLDWVRVAVKDYPGEKSKGPSMVVADMKVGGETNVSARFSGVCCDTELFEEGPTKLYVRSGTVTEGSREQKDLTGDILLLDERTRFFVEERGVERQSTLSGFLHNCRDVGSGAVFVRVAESDTVRGERLFRATRVVGVCVFDVSVEKNREQEGRSQFAPCVSRDEGDDFGYLSIRGRTNVGLIGPSLRPLVAPCGLQAVARQGCHGRCWYFSGCSESVLNKIVALHQWHVSKEEGRVVVNVTGLQMEAVGTASDGVCGSCGLPAVS